MALKEKVRFTRGAIADKHRYMSRFSFWWNFVIRLVIFGLIALGLRVLIQHESDPRVGSAPAIQLASTSQPQSLPVGPGGSVRTIREFHLNFKRGVYGHWPKGYHYSGSYKAAWIKSANRHLHNRAKANRYYYAMIRTTTCQAAVYSTLTCRMRFPSVRYNWLHPADNSASRKWALRVGWCGAVAVTEYYTQGSATRPLLAVGGKAMGECLPSFLIP